jgi:hypothetical protein
VNDIGNTVWAVPKGFIPIQDLRHSKPVPRDADYASLIQSSQPIFVQHTRLDSRNPAIVLLSTMAFAAN